MKHIHRTIVGAIIESTDQRILLGRRDSEGGGVYPNCWHLPGGGVEAGETYEEAVIREVREEVGIDLTGCPLCLVDDLGHGETEKRLESGEVVLCSMRFFMYRVSLPQAAREIETLASSEFSELRWVSYGELEVLPLVPAGRPLFKRLGMISA